MTENVLEFNKLSKSFGKQEVLLNLSTSVKRGEVIGLLGLNGAGKSTLLETALGFTLPTGGEAKVFGHNSATDLTAATKARIGFVPQQEELLSSIHGKQYLALIAGFYPKWNAVLVSRLASEWLVPLDKKISTLSVGQRQKLAIIAAMGHEPELLVLDEPVASLDPVARRQFLKELVDIASSHTRSVIFSTHIVSDLERVASRVWLLQDGVLRINEELDALKEQCAKLQLPPGLRWDEIKGEMLALSCREDTHSSTVVLTNWSVTTHSALEAACATRLTPEFLSLEDIFLELHQ